MTMDERVQLATSAVYMAAPAGSDDWVSIIVAERMARAALAAAFPELHGDPPKGWIAPWEATPDMCMGMMLGNFQQQAWKFARMAYLGEKVNGKTIPEWAEAAGAFDNALIEFGDSYLGKGDGG